MLQIMSLLMPLEKVQAVESLPTARTIAGEHGLRVVIEFMSSAVLCSCEDLGLEVSMRDGVRRQTARAGRHTFPQPS